MNVKNMEVVATNQVNFPTMVLVYSIDYDIDDYVIAKIGSAMVDSQWYVENQTARKYKLYYSHVRDSYYFKKDGVKYYMDETMRRF